MNIEEYIKDKIDLIDKHINLLIPKSNDPLYKAARYSLASGKRLRPILVLATLESLGTKTNDALDAACSIELAHTYSLIHDDLPLMDDDDMRRNKPSLHKTVPSWLALLTGNYLLTYAFEVLTASSSYTEKQKVELVLALSRSLGGENMIGGQVLDMASEGKSISLDTLLSMHNKKTASLMACCIEFGAIIADISLEKREKLKAFGTKLGLAFQIIDDILDVTSKNNILGKNVHSDEKKNKCTAITILGLEQAKEMVQDLYSASLQDLSYACKNPELLHALANKCIQRNF